MRGLLNHDNLWFGSYQLHWTFRVFCRVVSEMALMQGFPAHCHVRYRYGIVRGFQLMAVLAPSDFELLTDALNTLLRTRNQIVHCRMEALSVLVYKQPSIFLQHTIGYSYGFTLLERMPQQRRSDSISSRGRSRNVTPSLSFLQRGDSGYRFHKGGVNIQAGKLASCFQ